MDIFTAGAATVLGLGMGLVVGTVWGIPATGLIVGGGVGAATGAVLGTAWRG